MAKEQIKSEKLTPFGGIFSIMEQFDALLAQTIDSTLGLRCTLYGYQYSEILRSLMCVYLCGGSCIEDVTIIKKFVLRGDNIFRQRIEHQKGAERHNQIWLTLIHAPRVNIFFR